MFKPKIVESREANIFRKSLEKNCSFENLRILSTRFQNSLLELTIQLNLKNYTIVERR